MISEQAWSNGRVGTMGTSYGGATQHAMAIANAPNLAAMVPVDAMSNVGRNGIRHNVPQDEVPRIANNTRRSCAC